MGNIVAGLLIGWTCLFFSGQGVLVSSVVEKSSDRTCTYFTSTKTFEVNYASWVHACPIFRDLFSY